MANATPEQVAQLYADILRRPPQGNEQNLGTALTVDVLTEQLILQSRAHVQPFIILYQAAFGRTPDDAGLTYWTNEFRADGVLQLWDYAAKIADSAEWADKFAGLDAAATVTQVYWNVLGRAPDLDGFNYWVGQLESGQKTTTDLLYDFALSTENVIRSQPAVEALQRAVANGTAEFDGTDSLFDFAPTPNPEGAFAFTSGVDVQTLSVGQNANGGNTTYSEGDHITGTADNTVFLTLTGNFNDQINLTNIDNVVVKGAGATINTRGWTGTENIKIDGVAANVTLNDLQSSKTQIDIVDANNAAQTIAINYDGSAAGFDGVANISVSETYATVKFGITRAANAKLDTIKLSINDTGLNGDSTLTDLIGHQTTALEIDGGRTGGKFTILGDLDASLTSIEAGTAISDLNLKSTEATRKALTANFGLGNDTFDVGNTLQTADVLDGGAGDNTLIVRFGGEGQFQQYDNTPVATIDNFQTIDTQFNSNRSFDFANVDGTKKVIVRESTNAFRLLNLDSTVRTIDVHGPQADALHNIYYADPKTTNKLDLNWINQSSKNDGVWYREVLKGDKEVVKAYVSDSAGTLDFENVTELVFTHAAGKDQSKQAGTVFTDRWGTNDDAWSFDIYSPSNQHDVLKKLTVVNESAGDLVLLQQDFEKAQDAKPLLGDKEHISGRSLKGSEHHDGFGKGFNPPKYVEKGGYYLQHFADIGGTNATTDISFRTADSGSILLRDVRNTASLANLKLDATQSGDIYVNSVGFSSIFGGFYNDYNKDNPSSFNAALKLRSVELTSSQDSVANINFLNALANLSAPNTSNGASIDSIKLTAKGNSETNLWNLAAGDVAKTTIQIDNNASVGVDTWLLSNNQDQGNSQGWVKAGGYGTLVEGSKHGWYWQKGNEKAGTENFKSAAGYYWDFANQAVKSFDFRDLTEDAVHLDVTNDTDGVVVYGTSGEDHGPRGWVGKLSENIAPWSESALKNVDVGNNYGNWDVYNINNRGDNPDSVYDRSTDTYKQQTDIIDVGNAKGDWFIGGIGGDTFYLGGGSDFVYGGAGKNKIYAGHTDANTDVSDKDDTNYIVTGKVGTNEIWASAGQEIIFLNSVKTATTTGGAPNVVHDFTVGDDILVIDVSDIEAGKNKWGVEFDLVWTKGTDVTEYSNTYLQSVHQTVIAPTNFSDGVNQANVLQLGNGNGNGFTDYTQVQNFIERGGALQFSHDWNDAFNEGDALTIAWHDTAGDLHISLAVVESVSQIGDANAYEAAYNFSIHEVVELVGHGQGQWINWQTDLLFTA